MKKVLIGLLIVGLIGGGVWVYKNNFSNTISKSKSVEKVNVTLKWLHQTQFGGLYAAEQKGFYEKNGLDVEFIPFDFENDPADLMEVGKAEFGVIGADELLLARANGAKIKALATIYQESPVVAYTLKKNDINSVFDFRSKKLGMENSLNVEMLVRAMIESSGLDIEEIELVDIGFDATELLSGKVDISTGYVVNEPYQAEAAGEEVVIFRPSDFGVKVYADVLVATEEMINERPNLVQAFVDATLDGWEWAIKNVDKTVQYTMIYDESLNFEHQKYLLESSIPLIKASKRQQLGQMSFSEWNRMASTIEKSGLFSSSSDLLVEEAYTNKFLINR